MIHKHLSTLATLLFILSGGYAHAQQTAAAPACPSTEFPKFLKAFSEDVALQKAFIKLPLKSQYVDPDTMETVPETLQANQVEYPILPNKKERREQGLMLNIDKSTPWEAKIYINQKGTGYLINYFFTRKKEKDACWRLVSMEDWSS